MVQKIRRGRRDQETGIRFLAQIVKRMSLFVNDIEKILWDARNPIWSLIGLSIIDTKASAREMAAQDRPRTAPLGITSSQVRALTVSRYPEGCGDLALSAKRCRRRVRSRLGGSFAYSDHTAVVAICACTAGRRLLCRSLRSATSLSFQRIVEPERLTPRLYIRSSARSALPDTELYTRRK
jgi:hypothetical protein